MGVLSRVLPIARASCSTWCWRALASAGSSFAREFASYQPQPCGSPEPRLLGYRELLGGSIAHRSGRALRQPTRGSIQKQRRKVALHHGGREVLLAARTSEACFAALRPAIRLCRD